MSSETLAWAIKVKIARSATKNVLMIISDLANHLTGEAFPSIPYLMEATGLSKRTIFASIEELVEIGILERTDRKVGRTMQIPVYLFHMPDTVETIKKPDAPKTGAKSNLLGAKKEVQKRLERGAFLSLKEVQKRTTEPSTRNQEGNQGRDGLFDEPLCVFPRWVPESPWNDWVAMRYAKKAQLTPEAFKRAITQLSALREAGNDPAEVLRQSEFKCWTDLYAVKASQMPSTGNSTYQKMPWEE